MSGNNNTNTQTKTYADAVKTTPSEGETKTRSNLANRTAQVELPDDYFSITYARYYGETKSKGRKRIRIPKNYRKHIGYFRKFGPFNYLNNMYTLQFTVEDISIINQILFNGNLRKLRNKFRNATVYDKERKNIQINTSIRRSKKLIFREGQDE